MVNTLGIVSHMGLQQMHNSARLSQQTSVNQQQWLCTNKTLFIQTGGKPNMACRLYFADRGDS